MASGLRLLRGCLLDAGETDTRGGVGVAHAGNDVLTCRVQGLQQVVYRRMLSGHGVATGVWSSPGAVVRPVGDRGNEFRGECPGEKNRKTRVACGFSELKSGDNIAAERVGRQVRRGTEKHAAAQALHCVVPGGVWYLSARLWSNRTLLRSVPASGDGT